MGGAWALAKRVGYIEFYIHISWLEAFTVKGKPVQVWKCGWADHPETVKSME